MVSVRWDLAIRLEVNSGSKALFSISKHQHYSLRKRVNNYLKNKGSMVSRFQIKQDATKILEVQNMRFNHHI